MRRDTVELLQIVVVFTLSLFAFTALLLLF